MRADTGPADRPAAPPRWGVHAAGAAGAGVAMALGLAYPFMPGGYDPLAVPLSTVVQLVTVAALPLVPIGLVWLAWEIRAQGRPGRDHAGVSGGSPFAMAALATATLAMGGVSLVVALGIGLLVGIFLAALWLVALARLVPAVRAPRRMGARGVDPMPVHLVLLPLAGVALQAVLAAPLTDGARTRAIRNAEPFIRDIEAYRERNGDYPGSLTAVWQDYGPGVVGIEAYRYDRSGDAYNLAFEVPRFLFDDFGAREWVVYNPRGDHRMISHVSWHLLLPPAELARTQGWYAVQETGAKNWRSFRFD